MIPPGENYRVGFELAPALPLQRSLRHRSAANAQLGPQQGTACVEAAGIDGPADGLRIVLSGRLYVYSVKQHAVRGRGGARPSTVVQDHRQIVWPDTFTEGSDDTLFMSWFDPQSPIALPTRLYAIRTRP
jgi:hypothetical protein